MGKIAICVRQTNLFVIFLGWLSFIAVYFAAQRHRLRLYSDRHSQIRLALHRLSDDKSK